MKQIYSILFLLVLPFISRAQLITTNPSIPVDNQSVVITFDATKGDAGLQGYSGTDVYAYTGVVTDQSTSGALWRYVKESKWLDNPASCKMTKIAANLYQITFSPSIRAFYGVPAGEKILKMAFVFRNSDGTKSGRDIGHADIFTNVYSQGLNVSFINPAISFTLVDNNQKIPVSISASTNDSIALFLDNKRIKGVTGSTLIDSVYATGAGVHKLISIAYKLPATAADTVTYMVKGTTQSAPMPLGVHDGINYIDDNTVTFVLLAPYKQFIYLLGDFNNWTPDNSSNLMYKDSNDTTRFWITINGLTKGKEYIFQYFIDGTIRIADPYCEKISDPWNDQYISSTIYPNLISYPSGKTTGIAGVIQTGQTQYNWQVPSFTGPDKSKLVIYELLIRDFTANHDIKTVTDTLAYLKKLGVNAIELMPFNEFDGNDSWGYNPCFYFAPDKAYGTPDDYKAFIDACHANGMAVIQDMVLDFSTNNSPLVQMYFANGNPTRQNPWYDTASPNTSYNFGNVFNHVSPYTRKLTDSITSFWMNKYKIDGFRFDFAKGWTNTVGDGSAYDMQRIGNLKLAADHIWNVNPNAYVILELFTANTEEIVLSNYGMLIWQNMNCAFNQTTMGFASGSCNWDLSGVSYKNSGWTNPTMISYMESHDEERLMYKNLTYGYISGTYNIQNLYTALKRQEMASVLFYTVPGPKMLWQFGELGYDVSINTNGRVGDKPIHWEYYQNPARKELYNVTASLIKLRQEEPVFSTSNYTVDYSGAIKKLSLSYSGDEVRVVANCDVISTLTSVSFGSTGTWYDYLKGDSITVNSTSQQLNLNPGEFHVYSNRKLSGYSSSYFTQNQTIYSDRLMRVFPNPVNDILKVEMNSQKVSYRIISIDGKIVMQALLPQDKQIDVSSLDKGIYIINLTDEDGQTLSRKIIKQ